jgi:alpha-1,6-mannosyltransferase
VLAVVAAHHAVHPESSPVMPTGGWATVWTWSVVAALALYALGVAVTRSCALALGVAVVVQLLPLASPLLLSKDAYAYWSQARVLTAHGGNPYRDPPGRFPADPSLPYVSESWRHTTVDYGPVWEVVGTAPAAAAGTSARKAELAYRALAVLGILAAIVLVARRTRNPAAIAFVGWNPLVALHFAGGGHNDAWVAVLLALAVFGGDSARGSAAWSAATFFKGFPGFFVPLQLARVRLRARHSFWLGLAATTAVLAIVSFGVFGTAWITTALTGANTPSGLGGVHWLEQLGLRYRYAVIVGGFAFACVYVALLVHAWRRGRARFSLATSALCLTAAQLRPWYALWPVVLAAAEEDAVAAVVAYALTSYLLLADAVHF